MASQALRGQDVSGNPIRSLSAPDALQDLVQLGEPVSLTTRTLTPILIATIPVLHAQL